MCNSFFSSIDNIFWNTKLFITFILICHYSILLIEIHNSAYCNGAPNKRFVNSRLMKLCVRITYKTYSSQIWKFPINLFSLKTSFELFVFDFLMELEFSSISMNQDFNCGSLSCGWIYFVLLVDMKVYHSRWATNECISNEMFETVIFTFSSNLQQWYNSDH